MITTREDFEKAMVDKGWSIIAVKFDELDCGRRAGVAVKAKWEDALRECGVALPLPSGTSAKGAGDHWDSLFRFFEGLRPSPQSDTPSRQATDERR